MYLIDREKNKIFKIKERTFSESGFKERDHLQEWLAKGPYCFGEELIIIEKEFGKFGDTNERIDLLAIDKEGNLVIIENKLDDSKRDVVWQALKYASYCSTLTKKQILEIFQDYLKRQGSEKKAEDILNEFVTGGNIEDMDLNIDRSQRVFFVAANFRKEVTSTALWLLDYEVQIKCFKLTLFKMGESLLLNVDQIIPTKESDDYRIKLLEKNRETIVKRKREKVSQEFWTKFKEYANEKRTELKLSSPPRPSPWYAIDIGLGLARIGLTITKNQLGCELYIVDSKELFGFLYQNREKVENELNVQTKLEWMKLPEKKASKIVLITEGDLEETDRWDEYFKWLLEKSEKFNKVFPNVIKNFK